jgi:N-acyl-D-aspartate/D-glutamate deacylase
MGNCGFTVAPGRRSERHLTLASIERSEDISSAAMDAGMEWRWETFGDYLDHVERLPKGVNYAGYVGHSAIRTYVMGQRAFEQIASSDDLRVMCRVLRESIRAGALGLSTSRTRNHATIDDGPVPSFVADWNEVRALVFEMASLGAGIFELANEFDADRDNRLRYYDRLRSLAVESGRPLTFACGENPKAVNGWDDFADLLSTTSAAGARIAGQVNPGAYTTLMGFRLNLPFDSLPGWRTFRALPFDEQRKRLSDPDVRSTLVAEASSGEYRDAIGAEMRPPNYAMLQIIDTAEGPYRTVEDVAKEHGVNPVEAMMQVAMEHDLETLFGQPFANLDSSVVRRALLHPNTVIGDSDAGAHVSQISGASIHASLISQWVRREALFSLERAVQKLTSDIASFCGFLDRGLIREGCAADLVIFDPETIGPGMPTAHNDLPGGAKRLQQRATGIHATVVNGTVLCLDGEHTGEFPGQLLRGPLAATS